MHRMNQGEVERIHEATLRVLEQTGVRLEHERVLQRVIRAGATPGPGAQDVRFPRSMVSDYLRQAPSSVELGSTGGETAVLTATSPSVFWTNPGMQILEDKSPRLVTSRDLATIAKLCNSLPQVQGVMGMSLADLPPWHRDFVGVRIIAESCAKHVRALCFTAAGMEALAEMKPVLPGNWLSIGFTAHGPLRWTHLALDIFLQSAGHGIPTTINGEPMAGATGPVSLAGSIVVGNAEILAGIVVNQILEPGRPVIYNLGLAHVFDMRHATAVTGGPENALFAVASAEMGRFYDLPSASWVSTDSLFDDSQASLEKMFGYSTHIQQGVSLIWGMGQLESEKTISLAQLVIDAEMIDYVRHFNRSFRVDDDTMQLELIGNIGIAGSFLESEHTLRNHRSHLWNPTLLNRRVREAGLCSLEERARERVSQILSRELTEVIDPDRQAELRRIEAQFRKRITKSV